MKIVNIKNIIYNNISFYYIIIIITLFFNHFFNFYKNIKNIKITENKMYILDTKI